MEKFCINWTARKKCGFTITSMGWNEENDSMKENGSSEYHLIGSLKERERELLIGSIMW